MEKIAALFVLYNPDVGEIQRIKRMSNWFEYIYIYDNTEKKDMFKHYFFEEKYIYLSSGRNDGLGRAYNHVIDRAVLDGFDWLAIFDQDSQINAESIERIKSFINKNKNSTIAVVAPFIRYNGKSESQFSKTKYCKWVINSGSFVNLKLIKEKGISFDEYYFLDRLDRDFCKQIEMKDLTIVQLSDAVLNQQLGETLNGRSVHSPLRNYYMARNRLYYNHKFYFIPKRWILNIVQTGRHIYGCLIDRKDTILKIKMIKSGIHDYMKGITGRKDE